MLKGIRGAIDVEKNEASFIYDATKKLLNELKDVNNLSVEDIISVMFTATPDLTTAYPAKAAREIGWTNVPMMCVQEMNVDGSLPKCIRVLLLVNWAEEKDIKHIYLGKAKKLRPDLV